MAKLSKVQIEVLEMLRTGKRPQMEKQRTINALERRGLIKLYVGVGWAITQEGYRAMATVRGDA